MQQERIQRSKQKKEMIRRVEYISEEHLEKIRITVGEAFVTNELFHNWGSVDERGILLLFDTDMKDFAEMYQHFGCELV